MSRYPTQTTSAALVPEALSDLQREVQLNSSSRSMESASVGKGGLTVRDSGSITIEDGGSLIIDGGNLVLGKGVIDGNALRNQIVYQVDSANGSAALSMGNYVNVCGVAVTPPEWSRLSFIVISGSVGNWYKGSVSSTINCGGRISINGSPDMTTKTYGYELMYGNGMFYGVNVSSVYLASSSAPVTIDLSNYSYGDGSGTSNGNLTVQSLFLR